MLLRKIQWATAGVSTLALLVACSHCSQTGSAADGSIVDAGSDVRAPRDARVTPEPEDADTRDADSFDRSWLPGDWDPPPGNWPRCHLLIARNPERDVTPLRWQACPSGRTGCRLSVTDWDPLTTRQRTMIFIRSESVHVDAAGNAYLSYWREYPSTFQSGESRSMRIVQRIDGKPIAAVAESSPGTSECGGYVAGHRAGLIYHLIAASPPAANHVLWSEILTPSQFVSNQAVYVSQTADGGAGIYGANADTALLHNADALQWFVLNRTNGSLVRPFEDTTTPPLDRARSLPDGYLARKLGGTFPIMRVWNDGHMVPLLSASGTNRYVTAYEADIAQPTEVSWVEATNFYPPVQAPVLYAATLAPGATSVTPRRVTAYTDAEQTGGAEFILSNGMALIRSSTTTAVLVRISDGVHWTISAEPGMGFRAPLWVSNEELWMHAGKYFPADNLVATEDAILRLRLDTLGPGTPAE